MVSAGPSKTYRAFAALLRQVRAGRWVVFAKGSVVGPDAVLDYLGRYTHRVAITNGRLRTLDPSARTLTFTYKDYADASRPKTLTLTGVEFIRRLRLHLLPRGFTKIRHYGLLGNNRRHQRVPQARRGSGHLAAALCPRADPAPRPAPAHLSPLPGHRGALHWTRRTLRQSQPLCPPLALRAGSRLHRYLMNPRPSHRRQSPPATAVPPQRRNGHAQTLSPRPSARSGPPSERARQPAPGRRQPPRPALHSYAGRRLWRNQAPSSYFSSNVLRPAAAASSNQRGKQRARVKSLDIPNRSAGRAAYLASLLGVFIWIHLSSCLAAFPVAPISRACQSRSMAAGQNR